MWKFILSSNLVLISQNLVAASLQDLVAKQKIETISPVNINGQNVHAGGELDFGASAVCHSLGFTRVVKVETQPCKEGETMINATASAGATVFNNPWKCNMSIANSKLVMVYYSSITCAR